MSHRDTETQRQSIKREEGWVEGALNHSTLPQPNPLPFIDCLCVSVPLWLIFILENEETLTNDE